MAARFKKPRDPQETSERNRMAARFLREAEARKQSAPAEEKPVDEEYKLTIQDYIKYSPTIAKELAKESPQILNQMINPVNAFIGADSSARLSEAIGPEINRAASGQGFKPQRIGSLEMSPKLAALARMIPGATDSLTQSSLGTYFSTEAASKAVKNMMGLSPKGITKGDLVWLGLMYGRPIKTTKSIVGNAIRTASKLIP